MKKIMIVCLLFILGIYGISFLAIRKTGHYVIEQAPTYLTRLEAIGVQVNYDDLKQEVCLTEVCLKGENVTVDVLNQKIYLGSVRIQFSPTSPQNIVFEALPKQDPSLAVSGFVNGEKITVENSRLSLPGFQGSFTGQIDLKQQAVFGTAQTNGLASFLLPHVASQARFLVSLLVSDAPQTLEIGTIGNRLTINGVPLVSFGMLFEKKRP